MRKILTLALICLTTIAFSQTDTTKKERQVTGYVSAGFSTTNGNDVKTASYVALEAGAMYKNIGLGAIIGRGNLVDIAKKNDVIGNYYYEFKASGWFPINSDLTGNVLFGWGGYFNSPHQLIEYGVGMTYNYKKMGFGVMYSNWDAVNYVTPNITLNF
jgi:hypothetical protein